MGGLKINENQQVIDADAHPIEGLWAAGNCSAASSSAITPSPSRVPATAAPAPVAAAPASSPPTAPWGRSGATAGRAHYGSLFSPKLIPNCTLPIGGAPTKSEPLVCVVH